MATGRSNKLVGQVGEFLVCAELGRRGLIATPFSGNVPGFDVIATDESYHSVPIQVKTSNGKQSWQFSADKHLSIEYDTRTHRQTVSGILEPTEPDLTFVFVWLRRQASESDRFFVLTHLEFLNLMRKAYTDYLAKHGGRRPVSPESTHVAIRTQMMEPFEDNWQMVEDKLHASAKTEPGKATSPSLGVSIDLTDLEKGWNRDWSKEFGFLSKHLVCDPGDTEPLYCPYLPWVGPDYQPGGILLMATAQNLGQIQPDPSPDQRQLWNSATGWPDRRLWRLYPSQSGAWRTIPIQPWMDGMLAALAGLWMFARDRNAPESLDVIARQVSVTNFFKHSLKKSNTKTGRQSDLNPTNLRPALREAFVRATRTHFVDAEIAQLSPGVVLGFNTLAQVGAFVGIDATVVLLNDPSWIKQGMSGVASEGGSWRQRVERADFPASLLTLVDGWLSQLDSPYSQGKKAATRIYLLHHWLDFVSRMPQ